MLQAITPPVSHLPTVDDIVHCRVNGILQKHSSVLVTQMRKANLSVATSAEVLLMHLVGTSPPGVGAGATGGPGGLAGA